MNRKTIEKLSQRSDYNKELFANAMSVVQNCQQLISKTEGLSANEKASLKDKQQQLEAAFKNAIGLMGIFANVQKAPLATLVDHSVEIFEAITDNIQTSVQKYNQSSKTNKNINHHKPKIQNVSSRPQVLYPFIKPSSFDFHNHQKNLEYIKTDLNVVKSQNLKQPLEYVQTIAGLDTMIEELCRETEVAVDVEHSSKSYQGFTCLLQFSSRSKDYIVDVLPLWKEIPNLKKVMQNQTILKVMHGADMDTKWFQRDFNIHIVNLFDTYRGARALGMAKLSYAYLLNYYCNTTTDKTYQLADWRQRPLSQDMLHYARLDTHFLLQIFDRLRVDIHQKALGAGIDPLQAITDVYAASFQVTRNEVQLFDFRRKEFYTNLRKDIKDQSFEIFDKIFSILDNIAQEEDISFDEIVNHRLQKQIISKIKQMLYHKSNDNIKIMIDKFLCIFRESEQHKYLQNHLSTIKQELQTFFKNYKSKDVQVNKKKKNRIVHLEQFQPSQKNIKTVSKYVTNFQQYNQKTYECINMNPFSLLLFEPITKFLSQKLGLEEKVETNDAQMQLQQDSDKIDQLNLDIKINDEQEVQEGIIQFKRINPNVIYTIEEAEAIELKHQPRKKRKQLQYEAKLRNKEGNIYELLQDQ